MIRQLGIRNSSNQSGKLKISKISKNQSNPNELNK